MNLVSIKLKLGMILLSLAVLVAGFALVYGVLGYLYGSFTPYIIVGALILVGIINVIQWLVGPYLINAMYRAKEVTPADPQYGWLVNLVDEVALYNKIGTPKVYIADVPFPNAFAYGSPIAGKRVAITLPLLRVLTPDEIKAVLGHELGHLKHKDVELLLAIGLIPAIMYWIGYSLMWSGFLGGGGGQRNGSLYAWAIGIGLLVVSFIFQFFILAINRMREAYADFNSAKTVPGGADNLERALAKITLAVDPRAVERYRNKNNVMKMLFFTSTTPQEVYGNVDELINYWKTERVPWYADFFSDHPHPAKRIQMLEKLKYQ
ncbi:Protease HtpX [Metallosphaera sp. J1]|uniref:zinc metalloprotease HtpX n=1 Tax=Metallosphaera javensis (ex Hofmann et al. 2022) TaxID=99938 RepID=UPI001EDE69E6|nr:zinc metalloprotease HtpX [Metallosphaera javensis (ex Hofmann et al. 2022)]MCG3108900.1 Protease HtpX [Metallosphaera javensis (ex Hofmann et al. 2022)]